MEANKKGRESFSAVLVSKEQENEKLLGLLRHYTTLSATLLGLLSIFGTIPTENLKALCLLVGGSLCLLFALVGGCWCSWELYRVNRKMTGKLYELHKGMIPESSVLVQPRKAFQYVAPACPIVLCLGVGFLLMSNIFRLVPVLFS